MNANQEKTLRYGNFGWASKGPLVSATAAQRGTRAISAGFLHSLAAHLTVLAALMLAAPAAAQNAEFIPLGDADETDSMHLSGASSVSDDGKVVVGGQSSLPMMIHQGDAAAFIWTRPTGMRLINDGEQPGPYWAQDVSADGAVVVGTGWVAGDARADQPFRWTADSGVQWLANPPSAGDGANAAGVSADGSVVVGTTWTPTYFGVPSAFRWTAETDAVPVADPFENSWVRSEASGVTSDGRVIVGTVDYGAGEREAFRWTESGGVELLGDLPGGRFDSIGNAISADGRVIVGKSNSANSLDLFEPFRWTEGTGMIGLGGLPGEPFVGGSAEGVSADGRIVVGSVMVASGVNIATLWTPDGTAYRLTDLLLANGVANLGGYLLTGINDISPDGRWVAGTAINADGDFEAFLARLPDSLLADGFQITPALNDTWYNSGQVGQGFFLTVLPETKAVFLGWLTFDTERPPEDAFANLGDPGHRWLTAFGPFEGNRALLDIEKTTGGIFGSGTPKPQQVLDGTIELVFEGCNSATLSYEIPSIGRSGTFPITRAVSENVPACEAAATDGMSADR